MPYVFTEQRIAMLSAVLKNEVEYSKLYKIKI